MHGYGGMGRYFINNPDPYGSSRCLVCGGSGIEHTEHIDMPCSECNGTGIASIKSPIGIIVASIVIALLITAIGIFVFAI